MSEQALDYSSDVCDNCEEVVTLPHTCPRVGHAKFKCPRLAKSYMLALAGRSRTTVVSEATKVRFTYKIKSSKKRKSADDAPERDEVFFVSVKSGAEEGDFAFMGTVFEGGTSDLRGSRKSEVNADSKAWKAFSFVWKALREGRLPPRVQVWHEGVCGHCSRKLTTPESIAAGIGPVCQRRAEADETKAGRVVRIVPVPATSPVIPPGVVWE